jgi:spore coat polysaccharide biosynthesis predicted glycosyltransferase SpsG
MIKSLGDKDMVALTYNDILLGIDIDGIISRKPRLLVFDRFDMYDDKFQVLEKLKGTDIIVIVDYKTQRHFCNFDDTCWVTLTENSLEVSL